MKTWREKAAPIIAETIAANRGKHLAEIKEALTKAYNAEPEKIDLKIWCNEVKKQLKKVGRSGQNNASQFDLF